MARSRGGRNWGTSRTVTFAGSLGAPFDQQGHGYEDTDESDSTGEAPSRFRPVPSSSVLGVEGWCVVNVLRAGDGGRNGSTDTPTIPAQMDPPTILADVTLKLPVTPSLALNDATWTGEQPDCEVADTFYVVVFRSEIVRLTIHRPEVIAALNRRLGRGLDCENQGFHNCPELEAILGLRGGREIDMLDGM